MLANRVYIIFTLGLLSCFAIFSQGYVYQKYRNNSLLFVNPILFKALVNNLSTLTADRLWLLSNSVGDFSKLDKNTTMRQFYASSKTLAILDPYFFKSISYSAT